jgi:hypothetical protein
MPLGLSLRFQSDRFDHRSELPEDCNAGNRFYGKDVAEFVATGLAARGHAAAVNDEDWGWLVSGRQSDGNPFEVAIYNLSEHREGGKPGTTNGGYGSVLARAGSFSASCREASRYRFRLHWRLQSAWSSPPRALNWACGTRAPMMTPDVLAGRARSDMAPRSADVMPHLAGSCRCGPRTVDVWRRACVARHPGTETAASC